MPGILDLLNSYFLLCMTQPGGGGVHVAHKSQWIYSLCLLCQLFSLYVPTDVIVFVFCTNSLGGRWKYVHSIFFPFQSILCLEMLLKNLMYVTVFGFTIFQHYSEFVQKVLSRVLNTKDFDLILQFTLYLVLLYIPWFLYVIIYVIIVLNFKC